MTDRVGWKKAAASGNNGGNCAEWRETEDGHVQIADTKDGGNGPVLTLTKAEWVAFLEGARTDEWVPSRP